MKNQTHRFVSQPVHNLFIYDFQFDEITICAMCRQQIDTRTERNGRFLTYKIQMERKMLLLRFGMTG